MTNKISSGVARADAVHRKPWPIWAKVLAYFILLAAASSAICFIDKDVMQFQQMNH